MVSYQKILQNIPLRFGWGVFFLLSIDAYSQEKSIETILSEYPNRQRFCLQEIAESNGSSAVERGTALLFLGENINSANTDLKEAKGEEWDPVFTAVTVRLLHNFRNQPKILYPESRSHLERQIDQFIKKQGAKFLETDDRSLEYESREILRLSTLYLWADYCKNVTTEYSWPDKHPNSTHLEQYRKAVNRWLNLWSRFGFSERGSPYNTYTFACLLNLNDYARDEGLKKKAEALADCLVADIAQESIGNLWGGARCRAFEATAPLPGQRLHFLLFDVTEPELHDSITHPITLILGHANYRPPPLLVRLGCEREKRGSFEVKTVYAVDFSKSENPMTARKYAYVTPNYILGSFVLQNERAPWQTRPWDLLVWDGENPDNHFFTFPGNQLFNGGYPPYTDAYYLWNADCFQYKNVLFCRFRRSDRKRAGSKGLNEPIDLAYEQLPTRIWIPNAFTPLQEEGGWWFAAIGNTYLAFRPLQGRSHWGRTMELGGAVVAQAAILALDELETAFLLEVEESSQFSSFDEFRSQIIAAPLTIDKQSVTFVSRRSDVFLFPLGKGNFLVNGFEVEPKTDPTYDLFSSPFIKSKFGSGLIEGAWLPYSLTLDFRNPASPMRIINMDLSSSTSPK